MRKFLLFALLVVTVATAAVTLGGYDKSPPGYNTEISAFIDQASNLAPVAVTVIHNDIAYQHRAESPVKVEFVIEEIQSNLIAKLSYESKRWRQENAMINKINNSSEAISANTRLLYRPKLC